MKLTYWVAECLDDASCYSIRCKTKREVVKAAAENPTGYGAPHKVVVEYAGAFDLLTQCLAEGSIYESIPGGRAK
jgi:hypothetical protein